MPTSNIDALLNIAAPTRKTDRPARGREAEAFDPALRQALATEKPSRSSAEPSSVPAEAAPEAESAIDDSLDHAAEDRSQVVEEGDNAAEETASESDKLDEDVESDEVEISEEAAAAVAAAQVAQSVETPIELDLQGSQDQAEAIAAVEEAESEPAEDAAESAKRASRGKPTASQLSTEELNQDRASQGEQNAAQNGEGREQKGTADGLSGVGEDTVTTAKETSQELQPAAADDRPKGKGDGKGSMDGDRRPSAQQLPVMPPDAGAHTALTEADIAKAIELAGVSAATSTADVSATSAVDQRREVAAEQSQGKLIPSQSPTATHDGESASVVDRARFVQRVEGAMRRAQEHDGRVRVRLSPPELGSLRIEMAIQNGVMTARLEAETPAARNLLLDNLPALRERLAQQDIRVERFEVDVRRDPDQPSGQGGSQAEREDRRAWQQQNGRGGARNSPTAPTLSSDRPPLAAAVTDTGLDVRV